MSSGQTHAIIHRVKHSVDKCVLKRHSLIWFRGIAVKASARESGGSGSNPGCVKSCNLIFAVSYEQTHAIIHRVKHKVDTCVLKRNYRSSFNGIVVRASAREASARETGDSGSNPGRVKWFFRRISAVP